MSRAKARTTPAKARRKRSRSVAFALTLLLLAVAVDVPAQLTSSRPKAEGRVFGEDLEIEVDLRPGGESAEALAAALEEALKIERLVDPEGDIGGGIGRLNRMYSEVILDRRIFDALERALAFCVWSQQAHGPLGGGLYAAWGLRRSAGGAPDPSFLESQLKLAYCERLVLDRELLTATMPAGTRVDLWGFERGLAVDRMVEVLQERGVENGYVRLGTITRAFGPGPGAEYPDDPSSGWVVSVHPGGDERIEKQFIVLRNQSLSLASRQVQTLIVDGKDMAPYIDQRVGNLTTGVIGVAAVTERALDAEALSVALFVMSPREGEFRLGALDPQPAARWYLGSGTGYPLISERGWSALPKWQPSENPFMRRQREQKGSPPP